MARKKPMSKATRVPKKEQVVDTHSKPRGTSGLKQASSRRKNMKATPIAFEVDGPPTLNPTGEVDRVPEQKELVEVSPGIFLNPEPVHWEDEVQDGREPEEIEAGTASAEAVVAGRKREGWKEGNQGSQPPLDDDWLRAEGAAATSAIKQGSQPPTVGKFIPFLSGRKGSDRNIISSLSSSLTKECIDPIKLKDLLWPEIIFYKEQEEVIYSVLENDETYVVAANQMGKDFVAAYIALYFFLSRTPCRILTTSVDHYQLEGVLWGEIRRFLQTSRYSLDSRDGGPLVINHMHLRKIIDGKMCGISYMLGRVSAKGEGMLGHHVADVGDNIPRTLVVFDEGSGIDDVNYEMCTTWAKRVLVIGNAWPTENFFRKAVDNGDVPADSFKLPGR